jgi:hypothetical protein
MLFANVVAQVPRVPMHHVPSTPALAVAVVGMLLGAQGPGMAHACLHLEEKGKKRGRQREDKGKTRGRKEEVKGEGGEELLSGSCCQEVVVRKLLPALLWRCVHLLDHR